MYIVSLVIEHAISSPKCVTLMLLYMIDQDGDVGQSVGDRDRLQHAQSG